MYLFIRLVYLTVEHHLSLSYFIDNELAGFLGFILGYSLFIYSTNRK